MCFCLWFSTFSQCFVTHFKTSEMYLGSSVFSLKFCVFSLVRWLRSMFCLKSCRWAVCVQTVSPAAALWGSSAHPSGVCPVRLLFWSFLRGCFYLYLGECLFYVTCRGVVADRLVCHAAGGGGGQPHTPEEGALRGAWFRSCLRRDSGRPTAVSGVTSPFQVLFLIRGAGT